MLQRSLESASAPGGQYWVSTDGVWRGHLEGDLIIGREGGTAIGTIVERTIRFLILVHLPRRRTVAEMTQSLMLALESLSLLLRCSLTWDQGKESAAHRLTTATGTRYSPATPFTMGTWFQ